MIYIMKLIISVDASNSLNSNSGSNQDEGDCTVPSNTCVENQEIEKIISNISKIEDVLTQELLDGQPCGASARHTVSEGEHDNNEFADYDIVEISISFVSSDEIREINSKYRDCDEATDVLSFPMWETDGTLNFGDAPHDVPLPLGDIIICPDETFKIHNEINDKTEALCLMLAHSFLHLLAWDHDTEERQQAMWKRQNEIKELIMNSIKPENSRCGAIARHIVSEVEDDKNSPSGVEDFK